jgi:hypothetical protein
MTNIKKKMFKIHSTKLKKIMEEDSSFKNKLFYRMRQDYIGILNTLSDIGKHKSLA